MREYDVATQQACNQSELHLAAKADVIVAPCAEVIQLVRTAADTTTDAAAATAVDAPVSTEVCN